ncbi:hypothetical protein BYT27DRAFT_7343375 [Phlegmacium glaucopus]|nr:hypothetical protein BYT27DRAFT_7343375 [Phlegmacium glaucopus]
MDITFKPPIGSSIQLATSLSAQTALLHFTAELTPHDHDQLIEDRARIQLWSDLPHNSGQPSSDGGWGALDLTYHQAQSTEEIAYPVHDSEKKVTLFLEVVVALPMDCIPRFSFTYRIIYPSGNIKWLGAFGQNGSLSFERSDHDLPNFVLDSWTFNKSRMARVYEVKQSAGALDVARIKNLENYCVRALGPNSFIPDLKGASLLFFVPRSHPSAIGLSPTCIFSASPGVSLTLSADGHITASGSGTLLFQVNEGHSEPLTFIRQVLSHAKLDHWNILAWDADSKTIVLATPKDKFPIKAVTIPLWNSEGLNHPIYLDTNILSDMLGTTEFSVFSPDKMRIHLFSVDSQATQKNQMVSLQPDSTSNGLVMSPIYTFQSHQATTDKSTTIWKTVILSPYRVQDFPLDDSGILPTPPPSPHLQPIAHLSQAHEPRNTAMSLVPSLPSETCVLPQIPISSNESETLPPPPINPDTDTHVTLPVQKCPNSPAPLESILTMFVSLVYSVFFDGFYRFFWGHWTSGSRSRDGTTEDQLRQQVSEGDVPSLLSEDRPDDSGDEFRASETLVEIPETEISLVGNIEIQTTQTRPSQFDTEIPKATGYTISGISRASNNTMGGRSVYLQNEHSDSSSKQTAIIALLYTTHSDSLTADHPTTNPDTPSINDKNEIMQHCVQFLDGSEPRCVVSRLRDVDVFSYGRVSGERQFGGGSSYSCCLLQYQLDWASDLKSERKIRISPPSIVDVGVKF